MRLLILGGTIFLGRYLTDAALRRGHDVTMFNRGRHGVELFPDVEKLRGDRDGGLDALRGRDWDAVIDTSGYLPRVVGASAHLLADHVQHYTFVSSISVYADFSRPGNDESAPVATLDDDSAEQITGETYGPLKALCERAAEQAIPDRVLTVRPGLIVGPHDPTDRFAYWPRRVARGGEVLAPGTPDFRVEFIDVRDLAEWMIRMAEEQRTGVYNATGPAAAMTLGELLAICNQTLQSDATFTWVSQEFLLERGVKPWSELPLWIPDDGQSAGFNTINTDRARAAGLTFRPVAETVRDTYEWDVAQPQPDPDTDLGRLQPPVSLRPEREAELLREWHQQPGATP